MKIKLIALCHLMGCSNQTKAVFELSKAKNSENIEFSVLRDLKSLEGILKRESADPSKKLIVMANKREALLTTNELANILAKTNTSLVIISRTNEVGVIDQYEKRGLDVKCVMPKNLGSESDQKTLWLKFFNDIFKETTDNANTTKLQTSELVTT